MRLSRIEQETIMIFNEAEATASIQTYNGKIRRRLEQLERDRPDEVSRDYNGDFVIPKGWIKINPTRILSAEVKAKYAESLRGANRLEIAPYNGRKTD